jgi:hypothetical protein
MAKYLQRSCPKCNGYLGIVVPELRAKMPVQAINGRCVKCGYRLAWVLVLGNGLLAYLLRWLSSPSRARVDHLPPFDLCLLGVV